MFSRYVVSIRRGHTWEHVSVPRPAVFPKETDSQYWSRTIGYIREYLSLGTEMIVVAPEGKVR